MGHLDRIRLLTNETVKEEPVKFGGGTVRASARTSRTWGWVAAWILAGSAMAADVKIAVVDLGRVMKAHPDTKAADDVLQKDLEDFDEERRGLLEEREKLKKAFEEARQEADSKALSEEGRKAKLGVAESKLTGLRELETKIRDTTSARREQLADQKVRMQRRIVKKLNQIVENYAKEKGYGLVLDGSGLGLSGIKAVIYCREEMDITEAILAIVRKETASPPEKDGGKDEP
jgi:outer membrane protein